MIKTVKVKLHNPSNHKRAILDRVFIRWTLAADLTLRWAQGHLSAFDDCKDRPGNYRANLITGVLHRHVRPRIKRFGLHNALPAAAAYCLPSIVRRPWSIVRCPKSPQERTRATTFCSRLSASLH